jgi:hypothetical protein
MSEVRSHYQEKARIRTSDKLGLSLAALSLLLITGDKITPNETPQNVTVQLPEIEYGTPANKISGTSLEQLSLPSKDQLHDLLNILSDETRTASNKDVIKSLRSVNQCTGLEIDESGIYLTARHCMLPTSKWEDGTWNTNLSNILVKNPSTGEVNQATAFIPHPDADVALLYAPTGRAPKPTKGVKISKQLVDNENLWLTGFIPSQDRDGAPNLFVQDGKFDESYQFEKYDSVTEWDGQEYNDVVKFEKAVMGIQPYGGNSGSPILNSKSEIVGVESGTVLTDDDFTNVRSNYDGARIVSSEAIFEIPSFDLISVPTLKF